MKGTPLIQQDPVHGCQPGSVRFFIARLKPQSVRVHDVIIDPVGKIHQPQFQLLKDYQSFRRSGGRHSLAFRVRAPFTNPGGNAAEALNGTTTLHTMALLNGASILRVHDVKRP